MLTKVQKNRFGNAHVRSTFTDELADGPHAGTVWLPDDTFGGIESEDLG